MHGSLKSLPRTGRPRKTTTRIDRKIATMVENSDSPSAVDIAKKLENMGILRKSTLTLSETGSKRQV